MFNCFHYHIYEYNAQIGDKYHKMDLMCSTMALALHWWTKDFLKGAALDTFWDDVVFAVDLMFTVNNCQ